MTPDRTAAIAATERDLADWLTRHYHPGDPEADAAELLAGLRQRGWRLRTELDRRPVGPPAWVAPPEQARARLAEARQVLDAKRRARHEAEGATS